jgi:MFS transporter, DHA1 family, multidrug resistance protein
MLAVRFKQRQTSTVKVHHTRLVFILSILTAFAPFATDMYLASFPNIARSLHTTTQQVQLSLSTFFLGLAVGQLFYGPLIDRFGRRKPLLAGVALFTVASFLELFAPNIEVFIGLRFLQAVGGCAGMVISRAIIRDLFDEREAARVMTVMMLIQGIGPVAAPVLGGYIVSVTDWHAILGFLFVFGAVCWMAAAYGLPETLPPSHRHDLHPGRLARTVWSLLTHKAYIVPTLAGAFSMSAMFAFISGSPFVFITLHGVSQQHYGWLFASNAIGMTVVAQVNRLLLRYLSPGRIFHRLSVINVVAALIVVGAAGASHLPGLVIPLYLCLSMLPLMGANSTAVAMGASGENAGMASSIMGVLQFGVAGIVSALVSALHDGTAYPMTGLILACSAISAFVLLFDDKRE